VLEDEGLRRLHNNIDVGNFGKSAPAFCLVGFVKNSTDDYFTTEHFLDFSF
jgi:hypothetical protein